MEMGVYALYQSGYAKLFTEAAEHSSESIFNVEFVSNPTGLGHSIDIVMRQYNSAAPLKNFVDSYWMKDGKPREESAYADSPDYEDLDPRFAQTIVYPGSVWMGETVKTDNTNVRFTNKQTGFIYKKYTVYTEQVPSDEEYRLVSNCSPINIMLLRYADVLLMYAEAKNELGEMTEEVWNRTVKAIRQRAGFTSSAALAYPGNDPAEASPSDPLRTPDRVCGRRDLLQRSAALARGRNGHEQSEHLYLRRNTHRYAEFQQGTRLLVAGSGSRDRDCPLAAPQQPGLVKQPTNHDKP